MKLHVDKNNININKSQTGKFCFQISTFFRSRSGSDACENKLYGLMPVGLKPNNHKFNFQLAHHTGLGEGIYVSLSKFSIFMQNSRIYDGEMITVKLSKSLKSLK